VLITQHIVLGRPFLGFEVEQRNALMTCEDDEAGVSWRRCRDLRGNGVPISAVAGKMPDLLTDRRRLPRPWLMPDARRWSHPADGPAAAAIGSHL